MNKKRKKIKTRRTIVGTKIYAPAMKPTKLSATVIREMKKRFQEQ